MAKAENVRVQDKRDDDLKNTTSLKINLGKFFPCEKLYEVNNAIIFSEEKQNETHQKPAAIQNEIVTITKALAFTPCGNSLLKVKVYIHHRHMRA